MVGYVIPNVILLQEQIAYNSDLQEEYHGYSVPGSSTADAVWRIVKIEYDSNKQQVSAKWANMGVSNAKWTDRATLTYS